MTTATTQSEDRYLAAFERRRDEFEGPAWLHPIRQTAIDRFAELGFPTTRHEDWKFTNIRSLVETEFALSSREIDLPTSARLEPFRLPVEQGIRLVFVNGRHVSSLSEPGPIPGGVRVAALSELLMEDDESLRRHLTRYADYHNDAFTALNTAFLEDGGFVYIPRGAVLETPIHLLFVSIGTDTPRVAHPRNLIIAEEDCQAAVVEEYISLDEDVYLSNVVTEVIAGDNAVLSHTVLERESTKAYSIGTLRVEQGRSSNVSSHTVLLGGAIVRNNVHPVLAGEGGHCVVNGLFMPAGTQHMDNFMRVEHAAPHCDSRQFYNGILDGKGHGVFSGRIVVHKAAQKTDAKQENRNVLLSDHAQVDSKPQLEIYADDVKCTHGATIGQLDAEAIFYLRARGIAENDARAMLLLGFAGECIERMRIEPVRQYVAGLVEERIPRGHVLEPAQ